MASLTKKSGTTDKLLSRTKIQLRNATEEKEKARWHVDLYGLAQGFLQEAKGELPSQTADEMQRLRHELEECQIELELQNAELMRTREVMDEALERYTELYDFAPISYFSLNPEGVIRFAVLAGATLLGQDLSQLLGRSFLPFVAPNNQRDFNALIHDVTSGRRRKALELVLMPDAGPPLFVQIVAAASSTGQNCNMVIIDITERREAAEELKMHRTKLESLVRERTLALEGEIAERKRLSLEITELNALLEQRVTEQGLPPLVRKCGSSEETSVSSGLWHKKRVRHGGGCTQRPPRGGGL